jgi:hypothetical protein
VLKTIRTMDPRDEEPLFPESLTQPHGGGGVNPRAARRDDDDVALDWDSAAATGRGKLDEIKAMIQGKSPGEIFAMARDWLEPRPAATIMIGFGFGFVLGRLLRRS